MRQLARKGDTAPLRLWLRRHLKAAPSGTADHWADLLQAVLLDLRRMPEADATCLHRAVDVFMEAAKEEGLSAESVLKTAVVDLMGRVAPDKAGRTGTPTDTRDRILEAALEVFSEKGFHHATMDEIADRAGVGKGTVYRYFSSKDNLFSQLVQARLQELEQEAEQVLDSDDHVLSMIEKYLGLYFAFFDRNQRLYRVMVQEHPEMDDRLQDLYVEEIMRRIPRLKRKIYEARYRGVLKDVNFQTVFYGVMGFIHGVIQRWLAHDCAYSLEQELPTVKEVLFYGFVNKENNTNTGG
ncbi:TetR/AcrR family transcriptional regulator [Desulfacinum hydrothermale]|uniref:TetR/AcrR family transcriptional regulator n=1 Tax=Desulfacinum hydrothermale TaxID=109258 RepID=UPI0014824A44|nr:TetR/AcrR family transcriptional regulator [Desulfacinum hydrothermale]